MGLKRSKKDQRNNLITSVSNVRPSVFSFPDDSLSKCQWIFTKLDVCIDIVEIWFVMVNGQISSIFDKVTCPPTTFSFLDDNFSKYQWLYTKLCVCIDIVEICFGIADVRNLSIFDRVICLRHIRIFISG